MKKINSINYGGKVIGVGLMSMLIVPGILQGLNTFFECCYISVIANFLFMAGTGILICFAGLLLIEFRQDKSVSYYAFQVLHISQRTLETDKNMVGVL